MFDLLIIGCPTLDLGSKLPIALILMGSLLFRWSLGLESRHVHLGDLRGHPGEGHGQQHRGPEPPARHALPAPGQGAARRAGHAPRALHRRLEVHRLRHPQPLDRRKKAPKPPQKVRCGPCCGP